MPENITRLDRLKGVALMNNKHMANAMAKTTKEDALWIFCKSKGYHFTSADHNFTYGMTWNRYNDTDTRKEA